ncbi:MAG TPA: hypothetical protein VKQ32_20510 [Polyangia bacterium]|nr:hypothetical protein [Polyangia bacterium]
MRARIPRLFGLCVLLGSLVGCGGDKASTGRGGQGGGSGASGGSGAGGIAGTGGVAGAADDGGSCPAWFNPGDSCAQGLACPADTQGAGYSGNYRATCDCVGGTWRCTFLDCPVLHGFDLPPPVWCGADVVFPPLCTCHPETNPQQGETYCVCVSGADAGSGG